jgi:hypothetical protein
MDDVVRRDLFEPAQEERVHRRNVGDDVEQILAVARANIEGVQDSCAAYETHCVYLGLEVPAATPDISLTAL